MTYKTAIAALAICAASFAHANPFHNIPPKYAGDDGVLSDAELDVYLQHKANPKLAAVDSDLNGVADPDELTNYVKPKGDSDVYLEELRREAEAYKEAGKSPTVAPKPEPKDPPKPNAAGFIVEDNWLLRDAYYIVGLYDNPDKDIKKLKAARLQYRRDNIGDTDQVSATGAVTLFRRWRNVGTPQKPAGPLDSLALSAGIEFDRTVTLSGTAKEVDVLSFRLDGQAAYRGITFFEADYFSAGIKYTTDFDGRSGVGSANFTWTPIETNAAIGGKYFVPGVPLIFTWQPSLFVDFQRVFDDGGQAQLAMADDFLFAGPVLSARLELDVPSLPNAFLQADGRAMSDLLDIDSGFTFYQISGNIPLDEDQKFLLSLTYRNGKLPNNRQQVDDIVLGLGVRF